MPCTEHSPRIPGSQLQDSYDSGSATGSHPRVGVVRSELDPADLNIVSLGADIHSFNKYLLCICETALFQALGLQELNKNPCMGGLYVLVGSQTGPKL